MKKYKVIDRQGASFMIDTHEEPMPLRKIRERFWSLDEARTEKFSDFTKEYIEDVWTVSIIEAERLFLIVADVVFENPRLKFMLVGFSEEEVEKKARKIIKHDYPDWNKEKYIEVYEIKNLEDVKQILLLN